MMPDAADRADLLIENTVHDALEDVRRKAAAMPPGKPGDCDYCGEWSGRLIDGLCAPCRDRLGVG